MLPVGHIAGGFLAAKALLHIAKPDLPQPQIDSLLWWGIFFSFAPDLDNFVAYAKIRSWWYKPGVDSGIHRKFYSHVPILWLVSALLIYFLAGDVYVKNLALMLWVGSWTHFVLDSIDYGVMWLWPWNSEVWALRNRGVKRDIQAGGFFEYWYKMVRAYMACWTFYCEILIIVLACYTFLRLY